MRTQTVKIGTQKVELKQVGIKALDQKHKIANATNHGIAVRYEMDAIRTGAGARWKGNTPYTLGMFEKLANAENNELDQYFDKHPKALEKLKARYSQDFPLIIRSEKNLVRALKDADEGQQSAILRAEAETCIRKALQNAEKTARRWHKSLP